MIAAHAYSGGDDDRGGARRLVDLAVGLSPSSANGCRPNARQQRAPGWRAASMSTTAQLIEIELTLARSSAAARLRQAHGDRLADEATFPVASGG